MQEFKSIISDLQADTIKVLQCLSRITMTNITDKNEISKNIEEYLCELENLCVKSRNILNEYGYKTSAIGRITTAKTLLNIAGEIEITRDGWLKITLNSLLPNCRHRISSYIRDTLQKLLESYAGQLPYFDKTFMAIVEYCNNKNHNALDNDNKAWKMIPNAMKGRIIEDDNQFILSVGLFTKESEELKCEVYFMPLEEGNIFMELLTNDML